jgi:hypothetical protein
MTEYSKKCQAILAHDQNDIDRFYERVDKTDTCWLWKGSKQKSGYGRFWVKTDTVSAHVFSCYLSTGKLPNIKDKMICCHSCRNKHCVNPDHLEINTCQKNTNDRIRDGTLFTGENSVFHKLTREQVELIKIRYSNEKITQTKLAKEFGVTHSTVGKIIRNENWKYD